MPRYEEDPSAILQETVENLLSFVQRRRERQALESRFSRQMAQRERLAGEAEKGRNIRAVVGAGGYTYAPEPTRAGLMSQIGTMQEAGVMPAEETLEELSPRQLQEVRNLQIGASPEVAGQLGLLGLEQEGVKLEGMPGRFVPRREPTAEELKVKGLRKKPPKGYERVPEKETKKSPTQLKIDWLEYRLSKGEDISEDLDYIRQNAQAAIEAKINPTAILKHFEGKVPTKPKPKGYTGVHPWNIPMRMLPFVGRR